MTRYTEGGVTIDLGGAVEAWVRKMIDATYAGVREAAEAGAEEVTASARTAWYGPDGVRRRTGLSGDIVSRTTVDTSRALLVVAVGSTDTRIAGKANVPVPYFVHRPRALSEVYREVSWAEYWATPKERRGPTPAQVVTPKQIEAFGKPTLPLVLKPNPKAADGRTLLAALINAPMRALAKRLEGDIPAAIVAKVGRSR